MSWLRHRSVKERGGQDRHDDGLDRSPGTMAATVDAYTTYLSVLKLKARTFNGRRDTLRLFLVWCQERGLLHPEQITRSILESYQRHLHYYRKKNGKRLSVRTQRDRLGSLKQYFSWLCRQRLLEANPASELVLPRPVKRLPPEPLSVTEVAALISAPTVADPLGLRDRAILELFYTTGIRRSEMCRLHLSDLQRERGILSVRQGKGGKDRVVPVGARALHWLERYLEEVRPLLAIDVAQNALFITGYGGAFNPDVLGRKVIGYLRKAGIERTGACHLLRHSCATHMLEGGADIRYIQQLLGHSKLETTAIYTHVSITELRAVHARCHPAERKQ